MKDFINPNLIVEYSLPLYLYAKAEPKARIRVALFVKQYIYKSVKFVSFACLMLSCFFHSIVTHQHRWLRCVYSKQIKVTCGYNSYRNLLSVFVSCSCIPWCANKIRMCRVSSVVWDEASHEKMLFDEADTSRVREHSSHSFAFRRLFTQFIGGSITSIARERPSDCISFIIPK